MVLALEGQSWKPIDDIKAMLALCERLRIPKDGGCVLTTAAVGKSITETS